MGIHSKRLDFILRIIASAILLQAALFKLSAAEQAVSMFSILGAEPWGRYLVGVLELVAPLLMFVPRLVGLGAGLVVGLMAGAILSHLLRLGVNFNDDGGGLFAMAVLVFINSSLVLSWRRSEIRFLKR